MKALWKRLSVLLMSIVTLMFVFLGLYLYRLNLGQYLADVSYKNLENVEEQQQFALTAKLTEQRNTIKIFANFIANSNFTKKTLIEELNAIADNSNFSYITYATPDGNAIENTGIELDLSDRDYFLRALKGETIISEPMISKATERNIITFSTPAYKDNNIVGVMVGVYDIEYLSGLLPYSFDGYGYTYIAAANGDIIANVRGKNPLSHYDNVFKALSTVTFHKYDNFNTIKENMGNRKSGQSYYDFEGENRLLYYAPLAINDWYILTAVPEAIISEQAKPIMTNTAILAVAICIIFIFNLLYFYGEHNIHIKELYRVAYIDSLTGLYNKKRFNNEVVKLLKNNEMYAFAMIDIDKFSMINDTLGYKFGDDLLVAIANVLRQNIDSDEVFGRDEGDRFSMLLKYSDEEALKIRLNAMIVEIIFEFEKMLIDRHYRLVISIGVSVVTDTNEPVTLIGSHAKYAQQINKGNQVSGIVFYSDNMRCQLMKEKDIENRMQLALENEDFLLYLQPKYRLSTETIYGAEALVRWNYGPDYLMSPGEFITIFERNGFITKLDMYMLNKTCAFIRKQMDNNIKPIIISINFSRRHLENPRFVEELSETVENYGIPHQLIEVELTESTMHDNEQVLIEVLDKLHKNGFTLSMDDFGSGYSSLGLLKNLPVDAIKLDKTFFTQYTDLERAKTVISNMITMTKELEIYTVAEGVETQENIDLLRELGCDIVQGYYFARPMEAEKMNALLEEKNNV